MYLKHPIPFVNREIPCLDVLLEMVQADSNLPPWRRASVTSSVRLTGKSTGLAPAEIPANRSFLVKRFKEFSLGAAGVSKKRLQNALSDLRFALKCYGLGGGTCLAQLTGIYLELADKLTDKFRKILLIKFLRYLASHEIPPDQVTDAHAQGFLEAMERDGLCRDPRANHQNVYRGWNRAGDELDGWPQVRLTVPRYREPIGYPWSDFPASFRDDVERYFAVQAGEQLFGDGPPKPKSPRTIEIQRDLIRCAASALVRAGVAIDHVIDLTFLCRSANLRKLLELRFEHAGRKVTGYLSQMAYALRTVALDHADLSEDERAEVVNFYRRVAAWVEPAGDRDRVFLRWFDEPANVLRYLAHPTREIEAILRKGRNKRADALRYQTALMIELWNFTMFRMENFRNPRLDEHMIIRGNAMIITMPADQVKNRQELVTEIPAPLVAHIADYLKIIRPMLHRGPSPDLFPGRYGGAKSAARYASRSATPCASSQGSIFTRTYFARSGRRSSWTAAPESTTWCGANSVTHRRATHSPPTPARRCEPHIGISIGSFSGSTTRLTTRSASRPSDGQAGSLVVAISRLAAGGPVHVAGGAPSVGPAIRRPWSRGRLQRQNRHPGGEGL